MLASLGLINELPSLIILLPFKLRVLFCLFFSVALVGECAHGLLNYITPSYILSWRMSFFWSPCFSYLSPSFPSIIYCAKAVHWASAFFQGDCFICRCRFSMSVGEDEFSLFLHDIVNFSMIIVFILLSDPDEYHLECE